MSYCWALTSFPKSAPSAEGLHLSAFHYNICNCLHTGTARTGVASEVGSGAGAGAGTGGQV